MINVSSMNLSFENHCVSNSPSKLDQWGKPRSAPNLVLLLARRSPFMLKERVGGSMKLSYKEIILLWVALRQLLYLNVSSMKFN